MCESEFAICLSLCCWITWISQQRTIKDISILFFCILHFKLPTKTPYTAFIFKICKLWVLVVLVMLTVSVQRSGTDLFPNIKWDSSFNLLISKCFNVRGVYCHTKLQDFAVLHVLFLLDFCSTSNLTKYACRLQVRTKKPFSCRQ